MLDALDSFAVAEEAFAKQQQRLDRDYGLGATQYAQVLIQKHIEQALEVVKAKLDETRSVYKDLASSVLSRLPPEIVALVALSGAFNCVETPISKTLLHLGRMIEQEVWAEGLRSENAAQAARLEKLAKKRGSLKVRRQAVRSMALKDGFITKAWSRPQQVLAGQWLLEVILALDGVFVFVEADEDGNPAHLTLTAEAFEYSQEFVKRLLELHPVPMPLLKAPKPWKGVRSHIECNGRFYPVPLVRGAAASDKQAQSLLRATISSGKMDGVLEALNAIQSTAWTINEPVLEVLKWAYESGLTIPGMPPLKDAPAPIRSKEWDEMSEAEQIVWRKRSADVKELNRGFVGEREILKRDLATAGAIIEGGNRFWTPVNMDYRGRVYTTCHFGFQRQDYVRGLFRFSEGKPLGERGLYWLKVHLANCGDFDKVSKKPFADRVAWVDNNLQSIIEASIWPCIENWWTKADKPFLFLAACFEYAAAMANHDGPEAFVSHLPVSFDGTCSGLQHLCAMTRAPEGALVNLVPQEMPQDVYLVVADKVQAAVTNALQGEYVEQAKAVLAQGVTRSLVKRNVMTYSYSSKAFGMIQQQLEDTMRPLGYKVLAGELEAHPYGTDGGYKCAKFLGATIFKAIEDVVEKPAEAMRFLQGVARSLAHEGKPTIWTTPLGLPVVLKYMEQETTRTQLYLHDHGVTIRTRVSLNEATKNIDKKKCAAAISPSFVHSMDACHLQAVVLACRKAGIKSFGLVHDSFGFHACDADQAREIIKEQFYWLYSYHNVLGDIHTSACEQLQANYDAMPIPPTPGSLEIEQVLHAEYAFA